MTDEMRKLNAELSESKAAVQTLEEKLESKNSQIELILKDQFDAKSSARCEKCQLSNADSSEKGRLDEERVRRLETLLDDSMNTIDILERKNTEFSRQVEKARERIDALERDRHNLCDGDVDDDFFAVDDLKSVQARKIVRLECTMAVLEAEVGHLSSTITDLEEQVRGSVLTRLYH